MVRDIVRIHIARSILLVFVLILLDLVRLRQGWPDVGIPRSTLKD